MDGAGVHLVRVFGNHDTADFDPFLMMDTFDSKNPRDYERGFPWHPHRGIETITYLIHGNVEHADSLGNKGRINDGECQWMTAGSGIIHQEMPKPCEHMLGAQLWLNLPAKDKMTTPQYRGILAKDIPIINEGNVIVHIIAGTYKSTIGAMIGDYVQALYLDIELKANTEWTLETPLDHNLFIYIVAGEGRFETNHSRIIPAKHAVLFNSGSSFYCKAGDQDLRFLLMSGKPLKEPIAWGGPIVMNTQEELELAFEELSNDTFIKNIK